MEWISINERFPDIRQWVLVSYGKIKTVSEAYLTATGFWYTRNGYIVPDNKEMKVTHWMPLPEPPNQ